MYVHLHVLGQAYQAALDTAIDIGITVRFDGSDPNCFYAPLPEISPVVAGDFIGDTQQGGAVNFKNVRINPHGNGTHTECVGHIAKESYFLNECLQAFNFSSRLISVYPQKMDNGDRCITREQLELLLKPAEVEALILRTLPNDELKQQMQYSGSNPPYLTQAAAQLLVDYGIQHLLIDLPSVDREEDGGQLLAHKAFWQYPYATRTQATITEMIYVPNEVKDGLYFLQMQITNFRLDASPSKMVIYPLTKSL